MLLFVACSLLGPAKWTITEGADPMGVTPFARATLGGQGAELRIDCWQGREITAYVRPVGRAGTVQVRFDDGAVAEVAALPVGEWFEIPIRARVPDRRHTGPESGSNYLRMLRTSSKLVIDGALFDVSGAGAAVAELRRRVPTCTMPE